MLFNCVQKFYFKIVCISSFENFILFYGKLMEVCFNLLFII